jgi:MYXO-CTERM domain-containing protein
MRFSNLLTTVMVSLALTAPALAQAAANPSVPEIGAEGSLAALTAVAGFAAILWHRRRRSS